LNRTYLEGNFTLGQKKKKEKKKAFNKTRNPKKNSKIQACMQSRNPFRPVIGERSQITEYNRGGTNPLRPITGVIV
jgi:hypothetical protein